MQKIFKVKDEDGRHLGSISTDGKKITNDFSYLGDSPSDRRQWGYIKFCLKGILGFEDVETIKEIVVVLYRDEPDEDEVKVGIKVSHYEQ